MDIRNCLNVTFTTCGRLLRYRHNDNNRIIVKVYLQVSEMKQLKAEVKRQMALQGDYKGWYHRADMARYARKRRAMMEDNTAGRGDRLQDE